MRYLLFILILCSVILKSQAKGYNAIGLHHSGAYYFSEYPYKFNYVSALLGLQYRRQLKRFPKLSVSLDYTPFYTNYAKGKFKPNGKSWSENPAQSYIQRTSISFGLNGIYHYSLTGSTKLNFIAGIRYRAFSDNTWIHAKYFDHYVIERFIFNNSFGANAGIGAEQKLTKHWSIFITQNYTRYFNKKKYINRIGPNTVLTDPQRNTFFTQFGLLYRF